MHDTDQAPGLDAALKIMGSGGRFFASLLGLSF